MTSTRPLKPWSHAESAIARDVVSRLEASGAPVRAARRKKHAFVAPSPPLPPPAPFVAAGESVWEKLSDRERQLLALFDAHLKDGCAVVQRLYAARVIDGPGALPANIDTLLDHLYELKLLMVVRLDAGRKLGGTWLVVSPRKGAGTLSYSEIRKAIAAKIANHMIARQQEAAA